MDYGTNVHAHLATVAHLSAELAKFEAVMAQGVPESVFAICNRDVTQAKAALELAQTALEAAQAHAVHCHFMWAANASWKAQGFRVIKAKFASTCPRSGLRITPGNYVWWCKGQPAYATDVLGEIVAAYGNRF